MTGIWMRSFLLPSPWKEGAGDGKGKFGTLMFWGLFAGSGEGRLRGGGGVKRDHPSARLPRRHAISGDSVGRKCAICQKYDGPEASYLLTPFLLLYPSLLFPFVIFIVVCFYEAICNLPSYFSLLASPPPSPRTLPFSVPPSLSSDLPFLLPSLLILELDLDERGEIRAGRGERRGGAHLRPRAGARRRGFVVAAAAAAVALVVKWRRGSRRLFGVSFLLACCVVSFFPLFLLRFYWRFVV